MAREKTFGIGEYAVGGRIQVKITGKVIQIKALEWDTREPIVSGTVDTTQFDWKDKVESFLWSITSSYYTEQIIKWITSW